MAQHLLGTRFAPHSFSKTIKKHKNVECTVIDQSICSKVRAIVPRKKVTLRASSKDKIRIVPMQYGCV